MIPTEIPPEQAFCRRCRRALNTHTGPFGLTYTHAIEARGGTVDHHPEPVPVTELRAPLMECDFCSAPGAAWSYRCADQRTTTRTVTTRVVGARDYRDQHHAARTRRVETRDGLTQAWGERWSACPACAELIEARDLLGLIARVVEALPAKLTRGKRLAHLRGQLHGTYSAFFDTLAPGRGRIEPGRPLGVWPETPTSTA